MSIADLIKYIDFLKERAKMLYKKVEQAEAVKIQQRVIANNEVTKVVEETVLTYKVSELTAEYDSTAKELRLAQQALERANHTTIVDFVSKY
jgi:hypothetical protein